MKFEDVLGPSPSIYSFFNCKISKTVEKMRTVTGFSKPDFCTVIGMSAFQYQQVIEGHAEFELHHLVALSEEFDISLNLVFSGGIDYATLAKTYFSNRPFLPERYSTSEHQRARVRTIKGIINYLENTRGPDFTHKMLARLQIKSSYFGSPGDFVSILLLEDFLKELQNDGFDDLQIREMGVASFWVNRNTPIGSLLGQKESPQELYRAVHEELKDQFDQIWNYRLLRLTKDFCTVEITPREQSLDVFKTSKPGTRAVCLCRQGVFTSMSGFLGHGLASLTELECMHTGSDRCVYHISWEQLMPSVKQRSESLLRFF